MQIKTKKEFNNLWIKNKLGNKLRTWNSQEELKSSGYRGVLGLRTLTIGGGPFEAGFYPHDLPAVYKKFKNFGINKKDTIICESAPDHLITIQGELLLDTKGLYLFADASGTNLRMRDALKIAKEYRGLQASILLKKYLTPDSYSDILELLENYSDSVIEFSAYSVTLGWTSGRNALIWEVRNY